jgi:uncharacterized protein (DUF169 family)
MLVMPCFTFSIKRFVNFNDTEYAQKTKIANPSNLWKTYFTSSLVVRQMREYCGEPDVP